MKKKKAMLFPYDTSLLHMVIHRDNRKNIWRGLLYHKKVNL